MARAATGQPMQPMRRLRRVSVLRQKRPAAGVSIPEVAGQLTEAIGERRSAAVGVVG